MPRRYIYKQYSGRGICAGGPVIVEQQYTEYMGQYKEIKNRITGAAS